jgi:hypothetical protein
MTRADGYYLKTTWETSTIDYPLISGLASSTAILGGNLSAVGLKDRAVIVGDDNPNLSFTTYTSMLSSLATLAFDTATEFIQWSGAKSYKWFDYDTGEDEVFVIDAENVEVAIPSITSCSALGTDADGVITCMDMASMGGSMEEQIKATIKGMSFWEKLLLMF